jgi:DNA mismatch endonuclease, patch repair protein
MSYKRDGRAPIPESELTSKLMSSIKAKDTKPELKLRQALRQIGLRGYRLHWKKAPAGRPDIAYHSRKVAIFVHGCFWHRCPYCELVKPKTHTEWWENKLENNRLRDKEKNLALEAAGWTVLVFWEHEINANALECAKRVRTVLEKQTNVTI